ncbi:MAG: hypothetical protein WA803_20065 [Steroidobacteraceae bacterium]
MTTHLLIASAVATVLVVAACASTPNVKPTASAAVAKNPACLTQTGSRISGDSTNCMAFGRSYSSNDIDTTGKVDVGDALQILDPSIIVHH